MIMLDSLKKFFSVKLSSSLVLVILLIGINALVLTNVTLHNYLIGYDAGGHRKNAEVISTYRLPTPKDSREYFSPPLPYLATALIVKVGASIKYRLDLQDPNQYLWLIAGKTTQFLNFLLSLGVILLLVNIADLLRPGDAGFKISTLIFIGMLPVYYKTFSQMRPEPYVAFFFVLALWLSLKGFIGRQSVKWFGYLGIVLGLLVLSRQWGFFIFPPVMAIFLSKFLHEGDRSYVARGVILSLMCSFLVGGWFYVYLLFNHESAIAFNLPPGESSVLLNHPLNFFFSLGLDHLFSEPIRPNFSYPAKLFPIIYSDTWGDYWGFFTFDMAKPSSASFLPYMNMAGIIPSLFMAGGFLWGVAMLYSWIRKKLEPKGDAALFGFLSLTALVAVLGYLWFLMKYPDGGKGATIKASYIIYLYPVLALLAAGVLEKIKTRFGVGVWNLIHILLIISWVCLIPAMLTRWYNV